MKYSESPQNSSNHQTKTPVIKQYILLPNPPSNAQTIYITPQSSQ